MTNDTPVNRSEGEEEHDEELVSLAAVSQHLMMMKETIGARMKILDNYAAYRGQKDRNACLLYTSPSPRD